MCVSEFELDAWMAQVNAVVTLTVRSVPAMWQAGSGCCSGFFLSSWSRSLIHFTMCCTNARSHVACRCRRATGELAAAVGIGTEECA